MAQADIQSVQNKRGSTWKHYITKLPRLTHLSASQFLYPRLTRKSTNASSVLHKEHFSSSVLFFLQAAGITLWPPTTLHPPERAALFGTVSQSGKKHSLSCPFCSYHHPTLPLAQNFHSQKASPNLIILVFHQVERFSRWRIGIWLLIYPCSLSAANGALQLAAIAWVVSVSLDSMQSILKFFLANLFRRHR